MKKYLLILGVAIMTLANKSDSPVDRLNVAGPLNFNKTSFNLSWTDKPSDNYYIQEYLPSGEGVDTYNQMMTIHVFDVNISLDKAVEQKVKELETRKKTDQTCNYKVTESPDKKEKIVDFTLGESKGDKMTIFEFNVYHYEIVNISKKKKGLVVYAYTKRAYGDNITDLLTNLGSIRNTSLNEMISTKKPEVNIEK